MKIPSWLLPYEPQGSLAVLVEEVNKIYHSFDAKHYDRDHPEIHEQLPPIWAEMIAQLPCKPSWRVLDFGCGTGFEAEQVLEGLGQAVEILVAFDPSPEMLDRCKARLARFTNAVFCGHLPETCTFGPFNLLVTNSLLHHLPNIQGTIRSLMPSVASNAFWLAGHEPSSRFYLNPECLRLLNDYSRYRKRVKWLSPSVYIDKFRLMFGRHPLRLTAMAAVQKGLFKSRPTPLVVDRIIDFQVAHSAEEVTQGRGLDFERMKRDLHPMWRLEWVKSYAYFGAFNPTRVPKYWIGKSQQLVSEFPHDGANFSMVWSRLEKD
jgi:SAM-dependent methyltransferase